MTNYIIAWIQFKDTIIGRGSIIHKVMKTGVLTGPEKKKFCISIAACEIVRNVTREAEARGSA